MEKDQCVVCSECDAERTIKPCGHKICNRAYFALRKDACPKCGVLFDAQIKDIERSGPMIHVIHNDGRIAKGVTHNIQSDGRGRWYLSVRGHKAVPDEIFEAVINEFDEENCYLQKRYRN